jgi:hypothetical protein
MNLPSASTFLLFPLSQLIYPTETTVRCPKMYKMYFAFYRAKHTKFNEVDICSARQSKPVPSEGELRLLYLFNWQP